MKIILSIYDKKAELYMQPFFVPTVGVAFRNLQDEIARGGDDNVLAKHPEDFQLFHIGHYEEEAGTIHPHPPKLLVEILDLGNKPANGSREPQTIDTRQATIKLN